MNTDSNVASKVTSQEVIILIGLQASGKSTFFRAHFALTHTHISKDLMRNNRKPGRRQHQLIEEALQAGQSVVIDNTNPTIEDRAPIIALGHLYGATVIGYFFEVQVRESLERNKWRQGHARVPDVAIFSTLKRLVRPSLEEGFDRLFSVRTLDDQLFEVSAYKVENSMEKRSSSPSTGDIQLRDVTESDLPILFEQQLDEEANYMAAFTSRDPTDRNNFITHWTKILADKTVTIKTILFQGHVAGNVLSYIDEDLGVLEVAYWLGKPYWNQGIATTALSQFLDHVKVRPIYARVAKDNIASLRVLQKNGFTISGEGKGFANARGKETEEYVLRLEANESDEVQ